MSSEEMSSEEMSSEEMSSEEMVRKRVELEQEKSSLDNLKSESEYFSIEEILDSKTEK